MHAHAFDRHLLTCPVCHRPSGIPPTELCSGLYTCQYCQEHFVVSWSGHYVRDPLTLKRLTVERVLRRQSRPFARILRDLGLTKYPSAIAVVSGALVLGLTFVMLGGPKLGSLLPAGLGKHQGPMESPASAR